MCVFFFFQIVGKVSCNICGKIKLMLFNLVDRNEPCRPVQTTMQIVLIQIRLLKISRHIRVYTIGQSVNEFKKQTNKKQKKT